jgi:hypothetical protein
LDTGSDPAASDRHLQLVAVPVVSIFALGPHELVLHLRIPVLDGGGNPVLDAYGREQITESDVSVPGCDFVVTASEETESNTTITRLDGKGMLPPGTPALYTSAVTWTDPDTEVGIKFEVHGPPRRVPDIRTDTTDHIAISCRSYLDSSDAANREEG